MPNLSICTLPYFLIDLIVHETFFILRSICLKRTIFNDVILTRFGQLWNIKTIFENRIRFLSLSFIHSIIDCVEVALYSFADASLRHYASRLLIVNLCLDCICFVITVMALLLLTHILVNFINTVSLYPLLRLSWCGWFDGFMVVGQLFA